MSQLTKSYPFLRFASYPANRRNIASVMGIVLVTVLAIDPAVAQSDIDRGGVSVKVKGGAAPFDVHLTPLGQDSSQADREQGIRPGVRTIFLVHGFLDETANPNNDFRPPNWIVDLADAIRSGKGFAGGQHANIVLVDWSAGAGENLASYFAVCRNVTPVGQAIAKYIVRMKIDPAQAVLIGHSLGGHIAGAAGQAISARADGAKPHAIVGIDEAGIGFEAAPADKILDASDAHAVISLKTSAWCGKADHNGSGSLFLNPIRDEHGALIGYRHPNLKPTYRQLAKLDIEADRLAHSFGRDVFLPALLRGESRSTRDGRPLTFSNLLRLNGTADHQTERPQPFLSLATSN
jgi:pimeloyl-ACP methyl ester carboxylesterase